MHRAIWWIKRDFRLADNAALTHAVNVAQEVLPLFAWEPSLMTATDSSEFHFVAWHQALTHLRVQLRNLHADVYSADGEVIETLEKLHAKLPFQAIYSHEEVGIDVTFQRDKAVAAWCRARGIEYREFPQSSVKRGGINRDRMTALWLERIQNTAPIPTVTAVPMSPETRALCATTRLPHFAPSPERQAVSEAEAQKTLASFLTDRSQHYAGGISSPNTAFHHGSRLSVHLAWGTITPRQVIHATTARLKELSAEDTTRSFWKRSLQNFVSRLHWRDHFMQRLETEPPLEFQAIHPAYRQLPYEDDPVKLAAWVTGLTGFPLVDAVMRCLGTTGFANFRMRAMAVSFACHALHLDWRTIHPPLARMFLDYEPGIHMSQLQMQAGVVGMNAIRVYNPTKQLLEQDPQCAFVKRWLPELRTHSVEAIQSHPYPTLPGYPAPIVDFAAETAAMKALLYGLRKSQSPADTHEVFRKHGSRRKMPPMPTRAPKKRVTKTRTDQPTLF
jgi:deoxyribodipyrimidine photo-lyase